MRRLWFAAPLVLAAALFPIGSASAEDPQPIYVEGITFGEPVRMDYTDPAQVGGPGEPSIKVDSKGTIYVAGVCCVARAAPAWYSQDDGKTFKNLPSPAGIRENGIGAEGDFAIDEQDRVYFVDTYVPSLLFTRWSDHGDTWDYTVPSATVLPGLNDRPWLDYSKGNLYMYVNHATHIAVWKSTDGALTWRESFTTIGDGQRYWTGHVAADPATDDVYLFGARCGLADVCAASSHDAGETWAETAAGTFPRGALAPFMVSSDVDAAGNVYGVFADTDGSGCDVQLAVSSDRGATWRQFQVNPGGGCATFPWVAAGDDGRVAVTWYHNPSSRSQNQVPASSEWRVQAAVISEAASATPTVTHGTLDHVIHKGSLGRDLWDYQQIAVGPDGRFHIAFAEDALEPCTGTLSQHGALLAYSNKCTTYVAQTGGPLAIEQPAA